MGCGWSCRTTALPNDDQLKWCCFIVSQQERGKGIHDDDDLTVQTLCKAIYASERKQGTFVTSGKRECNLYSGLSSIVLSSLVANPSMPVFIYQGGWTQFGKPTPWLIYKCVIKNKLVNLPNFAVIGVDCPFDHPITHRRAMNFCGYQDQYSIFRTVDVLNEGNTVNPVFLLAGSKGALNALHVLSTLSSSLVDDSSDGKNANQGRLRRITGAIIESPPLSLESALAQQPGGTLVTKFIHWWCPNLEANRSAIQPLLAKPFPKIPFLFASLPEDTISPLPALRSWISALKQSNNAIKHFILPRSEAKGMKHGSLGRNTLYQWVVNLWIKDILRPL